MDANGHRFWLLASAADYDLSPGGAAWGDACLRLAGSATSIETSAPRSQALAMADLPPVTADRFGTWAWFDPDAGDADEEGVIVASGAGTGSDPILPVPSGAAMRDLSVDGDGVLRIAGSATGGEAGMAIADIRRRWSTPYFIETPGAQPDRVADGWLMERATGRIWTERGEPISDLAVRAYAEHIFRPHPEYANPPRLEELDPVETSGSERIADCAAGPDGTLAVLVLSAAQSRAARIVFVDARGRRSSADVPVSGFPGSIGWVSATRLALLYPDAPNALALDTGGGLSQTLTIAPNRFPLKGDGPRRLCRGSVLPVHVAKYRNDRPETPRPLHPISLPGYARTGTATSIEDIDAGTIGTVWHRIVVEGDFPNGSGAAIGLQVADATDDLDAAPVAWHHFGHSAGAADAPKGAWISEPSELPFHPGTMGVPPVQDRTGCFIALAQGTGTQSRELAGRYARVTVTLTGSGQATPRIGAVRVYANRFSLVRNYLPPVFHPPADPMLRGEAGPAHPRDFLDRHVAMYEGVLARLEDKIASAHLLTDPDAAPEDALDWLSGWIGLTLSPGLSTGRRRRMLANAMRLHKRRGTMGGLRLALDIASGGQVGQGGIVALEDFRLRRVFATILGADLGAKFDPLLGGPVESGNSFVGPTLHLGDAEEVDDAGNPQLSATQETELMALFRAPDDTAAADAVRGFFAQLAWRVTVLIHHDTDEAEFNLLRDTARQMAPAHISLRVERATKPLILGLYSLVGVDTYLRPRPGPAPVRVDESILGEKDFVLRLPALDSRLEQGET